MTDVTKAIVDLLATTEGRDKLLKGLASGMRIVAERSGDKNHKSFAGSVSEARSILRLGGAAANAAKIRDLVAGGKVTAADGAMVLRLLGDAVYSVNDNVAYLGKYLKWDAAVVKSAVDRSFVGMFWGFLIAVLLDVYALVVMDRAASREKWRARVLLLTRNTCDMIAALNNVKYIKSLNLSGTQVGTLGVISAAVSTYENWNKALEKQQPAKK